MNNVKLWNHFGRNATPAGTVGPTSSSLMSLNSPFGASVTQLPPPEFADFPSDQCPATVTTATAVMANSSLTCSSSGAGSNGRASMISSSTVSFRPNSVAAVPSSASTLPRKSTAVFYSNEQQQQHHPLLSSTSGTLPSQQRTSSLKKKSNKRVPSPVSGVGGTNMDELRV